MSDDWKSVWEGQHVAQANNLSDLINLAGFNVGLGKETEETWRYYCSKIVQLLELDSESAVFEYGCGPGALLYGLNEISSINVGGLDYVQKSIDVARSVLPQGEFIVANMVECTPSCKWSHVLCNSALQYITAHDCKRLLDSTLSNRHPVVAFMDVPNARLQADCEAARAEKEDISLYKVTGAKQLVHTYYRTEWFVEFADRHDYSLEIIPQTELSLSEQAPFRFSALFKK